MANSIKITKGWPPKRRREYKHRILRAKIWLHSTGPKTAAGKSRASRNALKHGCYSEIWKDVRAALKAQRHFLRMVMKPSLKTHHVNQWIAAYLVRNIPLTPAQGCLILTDHGTCRSPENLRHNRTGLFHCGG
jgi:hypothetical protein